MEGDGEGLVAIVQGVDDAGVTLTVVTRPREHAERRRSTKPRHIEINQRSPVNQMPSVDTSTNLTRTANTGVQICDGRYASSYKLAHCRLTPTSPPERVSEFPPQRQEFCRNQGNFEVGGHGSGQIRGSSTKIRRYGGSQHWGERGAVYRSKSSRETDAFVHSLRKYPSVTPVRTVSTDLIEKLIMYTQAKNSQKSSRVTKSMRSLNKNQSSDTNNITKVSKHQQTYTRSRQNVNENGCNTGNLHLSYKGRSRNFKLYSPMSDSKNIKCREPAFNSSYDYLKAAMSSHHIDRSDRSPRPERYVRRERSPQSDRSPRPDRSPRRDRSFQFDRSPQPDRSPPLDGSPRPDRSPQVERSLQFDRSPRADHMPQPECLPLPDRSLRFDRTTRIDRSCRIDRSPRSDRSIDRDVRLSDVSRYIRSTIRQIYNERLVFQVCPKLKTRYYQHKRDSCPIKNIDSMLEDEDDQASIPAISRILASFSGFGKFSNAAELDSPDLSDVNCYSAKASQCSCKPDASTSTSLIESKATQPLTSSYCHCCPYTTNKSSQGRPECDCIAAATEPLKCPCGQEEREYYNKRIDEEISDWLKDVPVHSIECPENRKMRKIMLQHLARQLKQLPDDEYFEENAEREINNFIVNFPVWCPGTKKYEEQFKRQLADKLLDNIIDIPRKPDRFRDAVKKWVRDMNFQTEDEDINLERIVDNFVTKLKILAADRPESDIEYKDILKKAIVEMLENMPLNIQDNKDTILIPMANKLAADIIRIPRNVDLSEDRADIIDEIEEIITDWLNDLSVYGDNINEIKTDQKIIQNLAKKLNKLQAQGIYTENVIEKMKDEIYKLMADTDIAIETLDEQIDELMENIIETIKNNEIENLDQDELRDEMINWLRNIPGITVIHPNKFICIADDLTNKITEEINEGSDDYQNVIVKYLTDADISVDSVLLAKHVEELENILLLWPSKKRYKDNAKERILKTIDNIIDGSPIPTDKKRELKNRLTAMLANELDASLLDSETDQDNVKYNLLDGIHDAIDEINISKDKKTDLKKKLRETLINCFDKLLAVLKNDDNSDVKQIIKKSVRSVVKKTPIDSVHKKDLMHEVKKKLAKNFDKLLPDDIKDIIIHGVKDILDESSIPESEKENILSEIRTKVINASPNQKKNINDIHSTITKDVNRVIDKFPLAIDKKQDLKENILNIFTEKLDNPLTDEVKQTIKDEIENTVNDLSISNYDKKLLKDKLGDTVSKGFDEAFSSLRSDISKIKNKITKGISSAIEKSSLDRYVKAKLKSKLKDMLSKFLNLSVSDESKERIIDDISNVVDDAPIQKENKIYLKNKLRNYLAKKLDTKPSNAKYTEGMRDRIEKAINKIIDNDTIPKNKKNNLKTLLKGKFNKNIGKLINDVKDTIKEEVFDAIENSSIPRDKKNKFKSKIRKALAKNLDGLSTDSKEVDNFKNKITEDVNRIIDQLSVNTNKKQELKNRVNEMLIEALYQPLTDEVKETIKDEIFNLIEDEPFPETKKKDIVSNLTAILAKNLDDIPNKESDVSYIKDAIAKDVGDIINKIPISAMKKNILKQKLLDTLSINLDQILNDRRKQMINEKLNNIFDDTSISENEKSVLKGKIANLDLNKAVANIVANKCDEVQSDATVESEVKDCILRGIERTVDESPIPEDKKIELKNKLKEMAAKNFQQPITDEVQDAIKIGIQNILNELPLSKEMKYMLLRDLAEMVDQNINSLREHKKEKDAKCLHEVADRTQDRIFQGIEDTIDQSPIPREKKLELKQKLIDIAARNLNKPITDEVEDSIKVGIQNILNEVPLTKDKKYKLQSELADIIDQNIDSLREQREKIAEHLQEIEFGTQHSILQGIENTIGQSPIAEDKKLELKQQIKEMAAIHFHKPITEEVQDSIKAGIQDILNEVPLPEDKKLKLQSQLTDMVDRNIDSLRKKEKDAKHLHELGTSTQDIILEGIEKTFDKSPVLVEKKIEVKQKLKEIMARKFNKPVTDEAEDQNDDLLREQKEKDPKHKHELETRIQGRILEGIEETIDQSPIPREKKLELKQKLKNMAGRNFNKPLTDELQVSIKDGIQDILKEVPLPKDKKYMLQNELTDMVDQNIDSLREQKRKDAEHLQQFEYDTQNSILQGIENKIDKSSIPNDNKLELKQKIKEMATINFDKPITEEVQDLIKAGFHNILNEVPISKDKKKQLQRELANVVDQNIDSLNGHNKEKDAKDVDQNTDPLSVHKNEKNAKGLDELEDKTQGRILQGIETTIDQSPISREKKLELKHKLKDMAARNLNKPFTDEVQDSIKVGIQSILNEVPLPKDKKYKLQSELADMVDQNTDPLSVHKNEKKAKGLHELEDRTQDRIFQGIEKTIDQSPIPREKKLEVKHKLKDMAARNLDKPLTDEVQDSIKVGIQSILNEVPLPKDKKYKLQSELADMVDQNIDPLSVHKNEKNFKGLHELEDRTQDRIFQGIEKTIDQSPISRENKLELKHKLKDMAARNLNKPLTNEVQDSIKVGIQSILNEVPLPKDKKYKLQNELADMVDQNIDPLNVHKNEKYAQGLHELEDRTQDRIFQGIEKTIDQSPMPREKKLELKHKLKAMAAENFNKPLCDDVHNAIKNDMRNMLDELPLSKDTKIKLANELTDMVDENMSFRDDIGEKYTTNFQGERKRVKALKSDNEKERSSLLPRFKTDGSNLKGHVLRGIEDTIEQTSISKEQKVELKKKLQDIVTKNQPLTEHLRETIMDDISYVLKEIPLSKDEKDKITNGLTAKLDESTDPLHNDIKDLHELETRTQDNIIKGIEDKIEKIPIPEEKRKELVQKLKVMAAENFGDQPISSDAEAAIKGGIQSILDKMPLSEDKKNKLQTELTDMVHDNIELLRNDIKERDNKYLEQLETRKQNNILQGIDRSIEQSTMPEEKKKELKQKLKEMAVENFNKPPTTVVQESIKLGISNILDELPLPMSKKAKLKNELTEMIDNNMEPLRGENLETLQLKRKPFETSKVKDTKKSRSSSPKAEIDESKTKDSILKGIEITIEQSPIQPEIKVELKNRLRKMATENFNKPLSDVQNSIKDDIRNVVMELPLSKEVRNELENALTDTVDEKIYIFHNIKENTRKKKLISPNVPLPRIKVEESLKEEVEDVLDYQQMLNISPNEAQKLEADIIKDLKGLAVTGGDVSNSKGKIKRNLMKDTLQLTEDQANDLSKKLVDRAQEMSLASRISDSKMLFKNKQKESPIKPRLNRLSDKEFVESPETLRIADTVTYSIDGAAYDADDEETRDALLQTYIDNATDIQNPSILKTQLQDKTSKSISDAIDQSTIPKSFKGSLKSNLKDVLQHNINKTPLQNKKHVDILKDSTLNDTRIIIDESAIPVEKKHPLKTTLTQKLTKDFNDVKEMAKTSLDVAPTNEQDFVPGSASTPKKGVQISKVTAGKEYLSEITTTIQTWVDKLPLELDPKAKETLIQDLTSDVLDRQKYLQLNPGAKTSDEEELEHLKYQVFRRFNRKMAPEDLTPIMHSTAELLENIQQIEKPIHIPKLQTTEEEHTKKRSNDSSPQRGKQNADPPKLTGTLPQMTRKSTVAHTTTESILHDSKNQVEKEVSSVVRDIKNPLREEITDVLHMHDISEKNRDVLEKDIIFALEELATTGGDTVVNNTRRSIRKSIIELTDVPKFVAEDLTDKLVDRARELSLIVKTHDSKLDHKERLIHSDDSKLRYIDQSDKEVVDAPEKIKIQRKSKVAPELKPISGIADDSEDTKDKTSMKIDVISIPKDQRLSNLKKKLKDNLIKDISNAIDDAPLPKSKKKQLKHKLNNVIEKDVDKSILGEKKDIDTLKQGMLNNINKVLDESTVPKDKINFLKKQVYKILNNDLDESVSKDAKENSSNYLDAVIGKSPAFEESNLRNKLSNKRSNDAISNQHKPVDGMYSFRDPQLNKQFNPTTHSTPKKNVRQSSEKSRRETNTYFSVNVPKSTQQEENTQVIPNEAEIEYTENMNNIIKTWEQDLPIKLEDKAKRKLIKDLTSDIVDRKKYMQINPNPYSSEREELDNLKYQVYKRLNKLVPVDKLTPIIEKTDGLMKEIKEVDVPRMIVPPGFHLQEDSNTENGETIEEEKRRKSMPAPEVIDELWAPILEEIGNILDDHNIFNEDREQLEKELLYMLEDLAIKGGDINEITQYIKSSISQFTGLTDEEEAENLTCDLVAKAKEIALIGKIQEKDRITSSIPDDEKIKLKRGEFKEAMLSDIGDMFDSWSIPEEKKEQMRDLLAEMLARDLGVYLEDDCDCFLDHMMAPKDAKKVVLNVTDDVNDWMESLPVNIKNEKEKKAYENMKKGFISKLNDIVRQGDAGELKLETKNYLQSIPLPEEIKNNEVFVNDKINELCNGFAFAPKAVDRRYGMSFNGLSDFIAHWLDNINIEDDTKNEEEIMKMKKDLAYNLIHKIGEMNVDPEIFNDVSLYEDVLRDEISNLLGDLTITDENFNQLKEDLIEKVKEAQFRAHHEIAGQNYKQNLRNTISQYLPDQWGLSPEEQANMELLKDQVADAFINLHYSGSNEDLKGKLKQNVANEINKFCNDYMKNHPDTPMDSQKLNQNLYNALKHVALPMEESMRYEVEQVRIRNEINDWIKNLPLEPQTPAELLTQNKMIYVLARRLFDTEMEIENKEREDIMNKEIVRFLKKTPLKPGKEQNIPEFAQTLIDKLKATETSRRFSESSIVNIDDSNSFSIPRATVPQTSVPRGCCPRTNVPHVSVPHGSVPRASVPQTRAAHGSDFRASTPSTSGPCTSVPRSTVPSASIPLDSEITSRPDGTMCPYYKSLSDKQNAGSRKETQPTKYPPCNLTPEDIAHLDRIRKRTCLSPRCLSSLLRGKRNTGVGPRPVDTGSQTELRPEFTPWKPYINPVCPSANKHTPRPCPGMPMTPSNQSSYQERRPTVPSSPCPQIDSRVDIQPHIIIKEYYWDSPDDPNLQEPISQQPSMTPQQQTCSSQKAPCDHASPFPGSKPPQRCPYYAQPRTSQMPQDRSYGSLPCPRPPFAPNPCTGPLPQPFAPNQQSTPLNAPGTSFRQNEYRMPKRDGLQEPGTSRPFRKERVIELGSLDDLCEPRPKKRNDTFDWSYAKFPEEDNFWGTPCMRHIVLDEGIDEPVVMEREKREERVRCKCKERLVPKCSRTRSRTTYPTFHQPMYQNCNEDQSNLKRCSKCCGLHQCPYPSYLYFRQ